MMHIGSALLVGIASFMSRHWSSVCPSICLSVNFSCPLWSYVHHTVDMKILCFDVVRPSGCRFIFSVHAIFDDPVKVIWWQRHSTLMPLIHLNTGSIMLLVMLSIRLFACLPVCLSIIYPSVIMAYFSCPLHISFTSESFFATSWY